MADALITLTTDFGTSSPFVAAMKGVILGINPTARLIDLSHEIPPYDLHHTAFFLAEALPHFPPGTIHVVVVDPEVGGNRDGLFVAVANQRLILPDNGCWTLLADGPDRPLHVIRLTEPQFWRPQVSSTFHGRDIFAPVAAYLSLGVSPTQLGSAQTSWRELSWPTPVRAEKSVTGEIIFVDRFGNLISNIPANFFNHSHHPRVAIAGTPTQLVRTYSDAGLGELVCLISSSGLLEVAVVQGNASKHLNLNIGAPLRIEWD